MLPTWHYEPDPGDTELLRIAAEEERILVTTGSDFGTLVYLLGAGHAGIVRLPDVPVTERIALMTDLLDRHGSELAGAIVTLRNGRMRISRPSIPG